MVSIPHYENLSAQQFYESLDLNWSVSEKLDGTYVEAGLDEQGHFYTQRKGGKPVYSLDVLPEECWTSTYRVAHTVLAGLFETFVAQKVIEPGRCMGFEVLDGTRPNTIEYKMDHGFHGMIYATMVDWEPSSELYSIMETFVIQATVTRLVSRTGETIEHRTAKEKWKTKINYTVGSSIVKESLTDMAAQTRSILEMWLPSESQVSGFTVKEVLDAQLNRKHENTGDRQWSVLRKELMEERAHLRVNLDNLIGLFKTAASKELLQYLPKPSYPEDPREGMVVQTKDFMFKLVDRKSFSKLNTYTHLVKYWIAGGRRPARPCFLSRTADWPAEKRLARLANLLYRYQTRYDELHHVFRFNGRNRVVYYAGPLHQRTLNLFADVKKRIEDGR